MSSSNFELSPRSVLNSDPAQQPRKWVFGRIFFPWVVVIPVLILTRHSYAIASYHAMVWAALGALALCVISAWWGAPMGRSFGSYRNRLKLTCLTWGLPLTVGIFCAFDLPAHYASGPAVTANVLYTTGNSRQCGVKVWFYLQAIDGIVDTCVGRDEVGAVPGSASGAITFKETPYGIELLKFQTKDGDRRDKWGNHVQ